METLNIRADGLVRFNAPMQEWGECGMFQEDRNVKFFFQGLS